MNIGDTIRIKNDNASYADVRAGEFGVVTEVSHEGDDIVCRARVGGRTWAFNEEDVEVIDVQGTFKRLTTGLGGDILFGEIEDLYDEPTLSQPAPEAVAPVAAADDPNGGGVGVIEPDANSDDPCAACPEGPHVHERNGSVTVLPHLVLTDEDSDRVISTDIRRASAGTPVAHVALALRVQRPSGHFAEVHLTEDQALALGAFIARTFRRPS